MVGNLADDILKYIFINEKFCISIRISLKLGSLGSNIGSGNGLAPNRRQAITWSNADPIPWRVYAALGRDKLINPLKYARLFQCFV